MFFTLSVSEERFEIAVESLQELVDLDDVVDRDGLARHPFVLVRLDASLGTHVLLTQAPQCELSLFGVAIADHSSDEIAGLALAARNHQHPHVRLAGENVDVIRFETAMTNAAPLHAVQDNALDLLFRGVHGCRFRRRKNPQFPDLRSKSSRSRLSMKSRKTESLSSSTPSARSSSG